MRLAAVSRAGEAAGLFPGQPLADARTLAPHLLARDATPHGDRAAVEAVAGWCTRYTPWAAAGPPEAGGAAGIWLDISGCAHLFGGETALLDGLLAALARFGYRARAGLADTPGAAWALARFAGPPGRPVHIAAPGMHGEALAPLPLAALRLPAATVGSLDRLGLRCVGDLTALPRAGLARRFGAETLHRLDQALGDAPEPVSPRPPAPAWRMRMRFPEPLGLDEGVAQAATRLVEALCERLERAERGARRIELSLFRLSGRVDAVAAGTGQASRDARHLARLLHEKLERLPAPPSDAPDPASAAAEAAIEMLILAATRTEPLTAAQASWRGTGAAGGGPDPGELDRLVDRLAGRLGGDGVVRFRLRESHLPERVQAAEPLLAGPAITPPAPARAASPRHLPPRPPRLLARPEPVEAVAPVPDDPPLVFRWRGRLHRVARAEGPERIAPEWWHGPAGDLDELAAATRDYYRVEDQDGRRFWLYREGLWDGADAGTPPRWFLHGLFG